jgi:glycosyltransferase involved in cell wall biosynthesis
MFEMPERMTQTPEPMSSGMKEPDTLASPPLASTGVRFSVVVPVYNEQQVVSVTHARLKAVMDSLGEPYELIFVDDGSADDTPALLRDIAESDANVRVLRFSRNFGHQAAIKAGIDHALGDAVIVIDGDLQDPPELIPKLVEQWRAGYQVVYAKRTDRQGETWFKRWSATTFYRLLRLLTDVQIPLDTGDFRLMDRQVCDVLRSIPEKHPFVRGLVAWVGFPQASVEYVREPRFAGTSKYSMTKMVKLSMDAVTSFSAKPLQLPLYAGLLLSVLSLAGLAYTACRSTLSGHAVSAVDVLTLVNLFVDGLVFLSLGIAGQYIARIYDEARNRPLYIVERRLGFGEHPYQQK